MVFELLVAWSQTHRNDLQRTIKRCCILVGLKGCPEGGKAQDEESQG